MPGLDGQLVNKKDTQIIKAAYWPRRRACLLIMRSMRGIERQSFDGLFSLS